MIVNVPGYTAHVCADHLSHASRPAVAVELPGSASLVVPQNCAIDALALCGPWLQACFYGPCKWARIFGPGSCTTCMTACLWVTNPVMAALCTNCSQPGPCRYGPLSANLACPYNVCAWQPVANGNLSVDVARLSAVPFVIKRRSWYEHARIQGWCLPVKCGKGLLYRSYTSWLRSFRKSSSPTELVGLLLILPNQLVYLRVRVSVVGVGDRLVRS